jgi:signal transduction histidine kinase
MQLSSRAQKGLFILGSFIVLVLAVLLYWRITELVKSFARIDHTNKIELKLEYALSYLKDAETGQRGFLLTRDSAFLEPYFGARKRVDSVLAEVPELISENTFQQQNYTSLLSLMERRFYLLDNALKAAVNAQEVRHFDLLLGKAAMDRIREHVNRMKVIEQETLIKREQEKSYYERLTPMSLLFLVFAMLVIIGFSYYGLTKQLQQTKKTAADLDYLNNELQLKNKHLENSVDELNSFNYIASHDLKEPLRKILFFTDILLGNGKELSSESRQYLAKILASGERMKNLLTDLLTYSQASMMEHKKEWIDLNVLLGKVVESLAEMLKEKRAIVDYKGLPRVLAVGSQMEQLFENLITNSVKYSKENEPPLIFVSCVLVSKEALPVTFEALHDQYHKILFSDNGIGFTQDNAEKIFELFQRLHRKQEFSGTGIGLTICRKIVQNHDGFITATSEVDKGTTFTIYLPV